MLQRRTLASRFLREFPRSFVSAQVHEAAAKSAAAMGDRASALFHARESLRLYPENPGLLVPLALWRNDPSIAAEALRLLNQFTSPSGRVRDELRTAALSLAPAPPEPVRRAGEPLSAYSGSASCANCHREIFDAWSRTGMANMLRPIAKAKVIGDFRPFSGDGFRTGAAPVPFLELRRSNGEWDRYPVDFVIGSKWQQGYATRTRNGDIQVLPFQFNALTRQWLNYWRMIDPPQSERAEPGDFHKFRRVTSYKENCAPCHTSQWSDGRYLEEGVNCEMCHGPSAAHARGGAVRFRFASAKPEESVRVCAQCHAQSAQRTGGAFPPAYPRRPYVEFAPRAMYLDGRFRETTFIVEAFERSACYRKGGATCASCHDPHPRDAATNSKSLKFNGSDKMCTQCHDASSFATRTHTRHGTGSEAARCVSCHMPKIMGALLFQAGYHQTDDRPSAELTARFGQSDSPNACLLCHKDKDLSWLRNQLSSWPRRSR